MTETVVAFTGHKFSGKSTASAALVERGYVRMSFADPIRDIAVMVFGVPRENLTDPIMKEASLKTYPFQSPREIMQLIGTECFRHQWPDVWVEAMRHRILSSDKPVVIDDLRFPNELEMLKELDATTIRINRSDRLMNDIHESESYIEGLDVDFDINNHLATEKLFQADIIDILDL